MISSKCRRTVATFHMLSHGDHVIVGLSGGADSCALLHVLCGLRDEYALTLLAVHVNHGIRGEEAARDAALAEAFCRRLNVPFRLYERDVPRLAAERGKGLEECGREVRYGIFQDEASACGGKIATAHTLSDSVETVLFHLIRGCALNGLRGIPPVRGNIIRPLIACEREEIEAYCEANDIQYAMDSSNLDVAYTRNRIRREILPLMRCVNQSVLSAVARLSERAAADDDYLNEEAEATARAYLLSGDALGLFAVAEPVASRALVIICREKCGMIPESAHIASMTDCLRRGEGSVNLREKWIFRVANGQVRFENKKTTVSKEGQTCQWEKDFSLGEIITPFHQKIIARLAEQNNYDNLRKSNQKVFQYPLDYDTIKQAKFRFRQEGDSFRQAGRGMGKSLKKLLNEKHVPPEKRCRIPLLVCGGRIAWIDGIGVGEGFEVTPATRRVLLLQTQRLSFDGSFDGTDSEVEII